MASKVTRNRQPPGKRSSLIDGEAASRAASTTEASKASLKSEQGERGRDAAWPSQIPALGWKDICWRLWEEFNKDRVLLVAAGFGPEVAVGLFHAASSLLLFALALGGMVLVSWRIGCRIPLHAT